MKSVLQAVKEWWSPFSGQWWRGDVLFPGNNKVVKSVLKVTDLSIELTAQPKLMLYTSMPAPESKTDIFSIHALFSLLPAQNRYATYLSRKEGGESKRRQTSYTKDPFYLKRNSKCGSGSSHSCHASQDWIQAYFASQVLGPIINAIISSFPLL